MLHAFTTPTRGSEYYGQNGKELTIAYDANVEGHVSNEKCYRQYSIILRREVVQVKQKGPLLVPEVYYPLKSSIYK